MHYPNITQYTNAIQNSESFLTLTEGITPLLKNGQPIFMSGNFAVVIKMTYNNNPFALKCFLKYDKNREEHQEQIVRYIEENPSPYFIETQF